jgi:hypothetical protein
VRRDRVVIAATLHPSSLGSVFGERVEQQLTSDANRLRPDAGLVDQLLVELALKVERSLLSGGFGAADEVSTARSGSASLRRDRTTRAAGRRVR